MLAEVSWVVKTLFVWFALLVVLIIILRVTRFLSRCVYCGGRIPVDDEVAVGPQGEGKAHSRCATLAWMRERMADQSDN